MRKKISIRKKIIGSTIGIVASLGIVAGLIILVVTQQNFTVLKKDNLKAATVGQAHEIGQLFAIPQHLIGAIAQQMMVLEYLENNPQPQDARIVEALRHHDVGNIYDNLSILDANGIVLASTDDSLVGNNAATREYVKRAMRGESFIEPAIDEKTNAQEYYLAQPILGGGGIIRGILVGKIGGGIVDRLLQDSSFVKNGSVMLIDTDGIVLYSNVPGRLHKSIGPLSEQKKEDIIGSKRYAGLSIAALQYGQIVDAIRVYTDAVVLDFYDSVDKNNEILSVARISNTPFFLIFEERNDFLSGPALIISIVLSIAALFSAMLAGSLIYVFSIRFLRPLGLLKNAAEKVGQGDFSYTLSIPTGDEFEDVADVFNVMIKKVQSSYADLEQLISSKTAALSAQLGEVEKKNVALQDTQRAVLNVLEDARTLELQLQEERDRLKGIISSMGEGLFVFDNNFRVLLANATTERILGIPLALIEGAIITDLITLYQGKAAVSKEDRPIFKIISEGVVKNIDVKDDLYWDIKGGKKFAVGFVGAPLSIDGRTTGGVIIFRDLTREKNLNDARTSFISITSHQLRTPLTSLKWFLEMLMDGSYAQPLTPEQKNFADLAYQAADRMMGIINLLLQIARIESGRVKVIPVMTDLKQFTQGIVNSFGNAFELKKQKVEISAVPDPLPSIPVDADILGQVLQNLLSNANRYALESTSITVAFMVKGDKIVASVADRGIGITKSDTTRIFEKFYRAENALRMVPEGSGLGLSLVKSLVEGWGGTIWFESEEWKDTTFFFTIPLAGMAAREGEVGIRVL